MMGGAGPFISQCMGFDCKMGFFDAAPQFRMWCEDDCECTDGKKCTGTMPIGTNPAQADLRYCQ